MRLSCTVFEIYRLFVESRKFFLAHVYLMIFYSPEYKKPVADNEKKRKEILTNLTINAHYTVLSHITPQIYKIC